MIEFVGFNKIPRLSRECIVTEKIDGTNAQVYITDDGDVMAGSRKRWVTVDNDNYGFAAWVHNNKDTLMQLGPGRHFGEWWGSGIQRRYGMSEKVFSLFNVGRWNNDNIPECCRVVPTLYVGVFDTFTINGILTTMKEKGSLASPGFMQPEGIVIYHTAARQLFKKTIENDQSPKSL